MLKFIDLEVLLPSSGDTFFLSTQCAAVITWTSIRIVIGKDKSVVWWSIQDHISALGDSSKTESSPGASGSKGKTANDKDSPKVDPRGIFLGHDSTVEDVQFCPSRYCTFPFMLLNVVSQACVYVVWTMSFSGLHGLKFLSWLIVVLYDDKTIAAIIIVNICWELGMHAIF